MSTIRVVPLRNKGAPLEKVPAPTALTKWASRHVERRNTLTAKMVNSPDTLIEKTHARQLAVREKEFERHIPFSWLRFFVGAISLVLVSSDVLRSGIGVADMRKHYPALQPDEVLGFGTSWNYTVFAATKTEASDSSTIASVWSYKFDSTSIVWRAFARYLNASDFPECLLYRSVCLTPDISGEVAFDMIDSLVDAIASIHTKEKVPGIGSVATSPVPGPVGMILRSENDYIDRLHQYLLPTMFINVNWRTNQALYYSPELLAHINVSTICFPPNGNRIRTPFFCHDLWTNFRHSCAPKDVECREAGLLYVHTIERLRAVQTRFPNLEVDLTFMVSQEDLQVSRGGLSSLGFRRSDVSTIIRARKCIGSGVFRSCETLYVNDYRYETGLLTSDVVQWYRIVAGLRVIGQSYFWLRGIGLMLSCYFIYGPQTKVSVWKRLRKARRLFMKIPTQCVVYGSPFPVACYLLAHLLDASFTYDVLESNFFSQAGVLNIKLESFISYAVVQMRNLWVYALMWQMIVSLSTSRWLTCSQQLTGGIVGLPEFLLSVFSSITLSAQYRSTSFRSARILHIMVMPSNLSRCWVSSKYQYGFAHRGRGSLLLGGVVIDLKFLICMVLVVAGIWVARIIVLECWAVTRGDTYQRYAKYFIFAPTPVPYSAGILWPTMSLCAHWTDNYFCIRENQHGPWQGLYQGVKQKLQKDRKADKCVTPFSSWLKPKRVVVDNLQRQAKKYTLYKASSYLSSRTRVNPLQFIQHQMKCLHGRGNDVEANVAFMNAVIMSDPLVYLRTKFIRDHLTELAYYQSLLRPHQVVLLPVIVVHEDNEHTSHLKLLRRVNASELTWSELVQCG